MAPAGARAVPRRPRLPGAALHAPLRPRMSVPLPDYVRLLGRSGIRISMTQDGNPLHNALAESVNAQLKDLYDLDATYASLAATRAALAEAVRMYNEPAAARFARRGGDPGDGTPPPAGLPPRPGGLRAARARAGVGQGPDQDSGQDPDIGFVSRRYRGHAYPKCWATLQRPSSSKPHSGLTSPLSTPFRNHFPHVNLL